jgi:hypothetical protein
VNWATYDYRDLSLAAMVGGWTDNGTGWSAANTLPNSFSNPPTVAKVMWSRLGYNQPDVMPTVFSPLGGEAFDSTFGHVLTRNWSEDLRRDLDGTMAFWFCPMEESSGVVSSLRGVYDWTFLGNYNCLSPGFNLGDNDEISIGDHVDGDWYLIVLRSDTLLDEYKVDLVRLRDEAQFAGSSALAGTALSGSDNYFNEGMQATLVLGSSWHWGVPGFGFYDRLALWNRVLTDDEILDLFSSGLGWQPG